MGTSLSGLTPATTFDGLLKTSDNEPLDGTLKAISTGDGTDTMLELSTSALQIGGATGMYWDNTNKRLGIGTDAPSTPLQVNGSIRSSGSGTQIFEFSSASLAQFRAIFGSVGFRVGSGMFIGGTDGGPASSTRLHIKGSGATSATTSLLVQNSSGTDLFSIKDNGLFTFNDDGGGDALTIENGSNISQIRYNDNLWLGSSHGTYVPTLKIDRLNGLSVETNSGSLLNLLYDTGNLGIGETTPTARLHVKGSGNDNTTTSLLVQNSDGTNLFKVDDAGNGFYINDDEASKLRFYATGNTGLIFGSRNLRIESGGGNAININGSGTNGVIIGSTATNLAANVSLAVRGKGATSATTALLVQNSAGTEHLKVTDDGEVNVRQSLYVNHATVSSRALRLGWGSIYATDNNAELNIGAVYSQNTAPRIILGGKTRASGADAIQVQTLNGMYIAPTASAENPSAQLHVKGSGTDASTIALRVQNSAGTDTLIIGDDGFFKVRGGAGVSNLIRTNTTNNNVGIGLATPDSASRMHIQGKGATSATTSLLVENSAGTDLLSVRDDATVAMANNAFQILSSRLVSYRPAVFGAAILESSAVLQATSTTQGFLPPRMTDAEKNAIATPAAGLMVYDTDANQMNYWNGSSWIAF